MINTNTDEFDHIREEPEDEDNYVSLYLNDIVRFRYDSKTYTGMIDKMFEGENGTVTRIAIKHLDSAELGAVILYNTEGGEENDAIEGMYVMKNLNPNRAIRKDELREKMFIKFIGSWGNETLGGWVEKLDHTNRFDVKITINPLVIDELEEKENLDMSMSEDEEKETVFRRLQSGGIEVHWICLSNVTEMVIPYPQKLPKFHNWVKSGTVEEIPWSGPRPGFKPGMRIDPYPKGLDSVKQSMYDMQFIKQHWRDSDMEEFFVGPTNLKGKNRQNGTELRKQIGEEEFDGVWKKYKDGWFPVSVEILWAFWAAKWGTSMFPMPLKTLFADDYVGEASKGRLLYGWSRENFEMIDETWQAHTVQDTISNFEKDYLDQDPFFGSTGICKRLMKRANEIR